MSKKSVLCSVGGLVVGSVGWLAPGTLQAQDAPPDLVVHRPGARDSVETGGTFHVLVTVQNLGDVESAATTVRFYRSTDATISTSDAPVGTEPVPALGHLQGRGSAIPITAPSTAGTYYYGACVDAVPGESDTTNNCSESASVQHVDGGDDSGNDGSVSGGDDDEPVGCTFVAPYWSGPTGGFTVMPASGRTSVSVTCGGTTTEYTAENGLVTRLLRSTCPGSGLRLTGAAPGGWYWQHGDRNAAVAPLVCSEALGGPPAVIPGGVTADLTDNGTWFRHDTAQLVGIVPHLAENECSEYVTPYWHGNGGIVVRPAEGRESVRVRVQCGRTYSTMTPSAGGDGVIAELVRKSYCTDNEGNPKQGRLTVTGADPGGWYWISGERNAAVGPLMCADLLGGAGAVDPGGVASRATDDGTFFKHHTENLIGVVPHVASEDNPN